MRRLIPAVFILFSIAAAKAQSSLPKPLVLKDVNGRVLRLSDYKGRVVLVNFWATWCPPCRSEIPELIKLQNAYRRQGLRIIGITYPPQTPAEVNRFMRKLRINYRVALGTNETKSLFTSSATLPITVVIDKKGMVREIIEGIVYPDEFDQKVSPLLLQPQ